MEEETVGEKEMRVASKSYAKVTKGAKIQSAK